MGRLFAIVIALISAQLAAAQSFEEAVRANAALALRLCTQAMIDGTSSAAVFAPAGFAYRSIDRGVNSYGIALGLDHYWDAPADTVKVSVANPDGHPGLCQVLTTHLTQPALDALLRETLFQTHPGARMGSENSIMIDTPSGLPLIITTRTITNNHRYEPPGTVEVTMGYPG